MRVTVGTIGPATSPTPRRVPRPGGACDDGHVTENQAIAPNTAEEEVATLCSDLIRIDTSNRGDHSGPGERKAAEHVAALLDETGLEARIYESHPGRASVVARVTGEDQSRPALPVSYTHLTLPTICSV